jgi:hypothetical protein
MKLPPPRLSTRRRRSLLLPGLLGLATALALHAETNILDDALPDEPLSEPVSPDERLTGTVAAGLTERAIPVLAPPPPPPSDYYPLYRLTRPYYDTLFATPPPSVPVAPDPATFRPVSIYEAPSGLRPRNFRPGLFEIYPSFGIAQSYDSNVNLTSQNPIADFFVTPRGSLEFQLGTPDSIYIDAYDTILALHGSYEGYGDIFYEHPELSVYNQRLELTGRIGRSSAIWRPYLYASDITGSNLLLVDLTNRTQRIRVTPGISAEYKFSEVTGFRQSVDYYLFDHPDPGYINFNSWSTRQEFTWRVLPATQATVWGQYRYTWPDRGSAGGEFTFGPGWQGRPDPRIYTDLHLGWGILDMQGAVPGRTDLSGLRFSGHTTFDWGPRFRPTLKYDRDYVFNEVDVNDNYVSTLLQLRNEFFLGGNYYLTPYLGVALNEFETSHRVTLQWRPEIELAYGLPSQDQPYESRIYVKFGYQNASTIRGQGDPITQFRLSIGCNWKY